ncbi:MAG: PadR family transcriptional regulator [Nitrososphaerales archaeon]
MVDIINAFIRGLEKPIIIWLISQGPKHGYGLIKEFRRLTGEKLKPSKLYPLLHRLEKDGFLISEWMKRGRRRIKYYYLTKKGICFSLRMRSIFRDMIKDLIIDLINEPKN